MAKKEEFRVQKLPMGNTHAAEKMLNDMFEEGYLPFLTDHVGADLVTIYRIQRKPGRPTDKVPPPDED